MPPREDQTDPTIEDVRVSEATCQRRTGEIMAIQKETLKAVNSHIAFHKGKEVAKSIGWSKVGNIAKLVSLILAIVVVVGGLIWNTATSLKAAEMATEAAKKVNGDG